MATCHKCKKEFSDEFAFCPFCGAKKSARKDKANFTNMDWIVWDRENIKELYEAFPNVPHKTLDAVFSFLSEAHDAVTGYGIKPYVTEIWISARKGGQISRPRRKFISRDRDLEFLAEHRNEKQDPWETWYEINRITVEEKNLTLFDLKEHPLFFLSKDKCVNKLVELCEKYALSDKIDPNLPIIDLSNI